MRLVHDVINNEEYIEIFLNQKEIKEHEDILKIFLNQKEIERLVDEFVVLKELTILGSPVNLGFMYTLPGEEDAVSSRKE